MAQHVIEGTWEEIKRHEAELIGRYLKVTIQPDRLRRTRPPLGSDSTPSEIKKRLDALNSWLSLPRPAPTLKIDDSRSGIYGEEEDRG